MSTSTNVLKCISKFISVDRKSLFVSKNVPLCVHLRMAKKKTDAEIIGGNIRTVREQKHLSQKELAAAIDVAPTQYSRVDTGKVMPTLKTLIKIAKVLDVPLDAFVNAQGSTAQEVTIKDKSLFDKVRLIDQLPAEEKAMILQVIDLALNKKKFKDLLSQIS